MCLFVIERKRQKRIEPLGDCRFASRTYYTWICMHGQMYTHKKSKKKWSFWKQLYKWVEQRRTDMIFRYPAFELNFVTYKKSKRKKKTFNSGYKRKSKITTARPPLVSRGRTFYRFRQESSWSQPNNNLVHHHHLHIYTY